MLVKNINVRINSSSGGLFTELALPILLRGGYVFGAAFDPNFVVKHQKISSVNDIDKLRGSKYVQSQIGSTLKEVKILVSENKKVLFVGTPCQIAGLKKFLNNESYPNLYMIDVVCHGVPSPLIF